MPWHLVKPLILIAFVSTCVATIWAQEEERPLWEQEALLIYSESSPEFNRVRMLGREDPRLSRYITALEILHGQQEAEEGPPYLAAQRLLRGLIEAEPNDAIGLAAMYYLARIEQSNPVEQDIASAKALYRKLYDSHRDRFFGQMALLKYAALEIYNDDGVEAGVLERIQKLEALAEDMSVPHLRCNFHRLLGEAYVAFELDPKRAYDHLQAAYELGLPVESMRVDVVLHLARLCEQLGDGEKALAHYDELILLAPQHESIDEFRAKAAELRVR